MVSMVEKITHLGGMFKFGLVNFPVVRPAKSIATGAGHRRRKTIMSKAGTETFPFQGASCLKSSSNRLDLGMSRAYKSPFKGVFKNSL